MENVFKMSYDLDYFQMKNNISFYFMGNVYLRRNIASPYEHIVTTVGYEWPYSKLQGIKGYLFCINCICVSVRSRTIPQ